MLTNIPDQVTLTFVAICILVLPAFLYIVISPLRRGKRVKMAWLIIIGTVAWLSIQGVLAYQTFYASHYDQFPPRFLLAIGPPMVAIFVLLVLAWKSAYFERISLKGMTYIHVFRFPLELIVLSGLATAGYIPEIMTYMGEGRNYDIIVGITAPIVAYLYFSRKSISIRGLLAWNIISLLFLINVTSHAILSLPYPFQLFAEDQPNIAVLYFPFIWLPTLLVGVAYFCHIISIHKLVCFEGKQK
jgi:hypothetical protein